MSNESSAVNDGSHERASLLPDFEADRRRVVAGVVGVTTLLVAVRTTVSMLYNVPFDPVPVSSSLRGSLALGTALAVSAALVVVALAARRTAARVGLLFAGVFGLLATVSPAATLPAVVAVTGGSALALLGSLGRPKSLPGVHSPAVGTAVVVGIGVSLASTTGVADGGLRGIGAMATLAGFAGVGARTEGDRVALAAGAVAAAVLTVLAAASPFVVGSVLLVEFGVVGAPFLLVAVAFGGLTAGTVTGIRRREHTLALGAVLLLLTGIPVTLSHASAVALGATLALLDVEALVSPPAAEVRA